MADCIHRGQEHARGDHETVFHCAEFGYCTVRDGGLTNRKGPLAVCEQPDGTRCEKFVELTVPRYFSPIKSNRPKANFCYYTGTNRGHQDNNMIANMIRQMRCVGVPEDVHVFSTADVDDAINHRIPANTDWNNHLAKVEFARQLVSTEFEYVVWLDSDNFFVRDPGDLRPLIRDNPLWAMMEADISRQPKTSQHGWYFKTHEFVIDLFRREGLQTEKVYSSNGGLCIWRRTEISRIADEMQDIHKRWKSGPWPDSNDEVILACVAAKYVDDPELNTFDKMKEYWACDWADVFKHQLPTGDPWIYTSWMFGEKETVNPHVIHCMRSKHLLRNEPQRPFQQNAPTMEERTKQHITAFPCKFRGDVKRIEDKQGECHLSASPIVGCSLHGEASLWKFCSKQEIRTCAGCVDRPMP